MRARRWAAVVAGLVALAVALWGLREQEAGLPDRPQPPVPAGSAADTPPRTEEGVPGPSPAMPIPESSPFRGDSGNFDPVNDPPPRPWSIRVVRGRDGSPVAGATVGLSGAGPTYGPGPGTSGGFGGNSPRSDADGVVAWEHFPESGALLEVRKDGLAAARAWVPEYPGPGEPVVVAIGVGLIVTGRVLEADSEPCAGALVSGTTTDDEGRFAIAGLDPARRHLSAVTADGRTGRAPLPPASKGGHLNVDIRLPGSGRIEVTWDGPAPEHVFLMNEAGAQSLHRATVREAGTARLVVDDLVAGIWWLPNQGVRLRVPADSTARLRLPLRDGCVLEGALRRGGEPVADHQAVTARSSGTPDGIVERTTWSRGGRYRFEGLGPGRWSVAGNDAVIRADIDVAPGQERIVHDLDLGASGTVRGTVRDSAGDPIAGASVGLQPADGTGRSRGPSDGLLHRSGPEGAFTLNGVAPGRHRLEVGAGGLATAVVAPVIVRDGETVTCDVVLAPAVRLHVRVLDTDGVPAPRVVVALLDRFGDIEQVADGPGWRATLRGLAAGRTCRLVATVPGGRFATTRATTATEAGTASTVDIRLEPTAGLEVRLRRSGAPVAGAPVRLRLIDAPGVPEAMTGFMGGDRFRFAPRLAETDADGVARFPFLSPARYRVDVVGEDEPAVPVDVRTGEDAETTIGR